MTRSRRSSLPAPRISRHPLCGATGTTAAALMLLVSTAAAARADEPPAAAAAPDGSYAVSAGAPAYSLPWQLRPAGVANVVRAESSLASYQVGGQTGHAAANMLLVSYKITPTLAPVLRLAMVVDQRPGDGVDAGAALVNPLLGLAWAPKLLPAPWRLAFFGGVALPVGMGGEDPTTDADAAAAARGVPLRSAMDNAMFAVNYVTPLAGFDVAYVKGGLTVQVEGTVLELLRARHQAYAPEASRTNSTVGLHAGYFLAGFVSLGADLRYQRWLTTPGFVAKNGAARDTTTLAIGPRFHFKLGGTMWLRPGLSYTFAMDDPVAGAKYRIVQVDLPFAF